FDRAAYAGDRDRAQVTAVEAEQAVGRDQPDMTGRDGISTSRHSSQRAPAFVIPQTAAVVQRRAVDLDPPTRPHHDRITWHGRGGLDQWLVAAGEVAIAEVVAIDTELERGCCRRACDHHHTARKLLIGPLPDPSRH